MVHHDGNGFKCDQCDVSYSNLSMINDHKRVIHEKMKDYICEPCTKAFGAKKNLIVHRNLVHFKIKAYSCIYCQKRFGTSSSFKRHQNTKKHIKNGNVPNVVPDRETSSTENVCH